MNKEDKDYAIFNENPIHVLPRVSLEFLLFDEKRVIERKAYTFMILIGDIGGFSGAIIMLPSLFMSWYSSKMFSASILLVTPIKNKNVWKSKSKVLYGLSTNESLTKEDIESLEKELTVYEKCKISFF